MMMVLKWPIELKSKLNDVIHITFLENMPTSIFTIAFTILPFTEARYILKNVLTKRRIVSILINATSLHLKLGITILISYMSCLRKLRSTKPLRSFFCLFDFPLFYC